MQERKMVSIKKSEVVKSEKLVRARYSLNPLAIKFITVIIANLKQSDELDKEYIFKVKDFAKLIRKDYSELYNELESAVEELLKKPIHISTDEGWIKTNWISGANYHKGNGTISFYIYPKLRPYLLEIKKRFLKYKIENILSLRSSYSIRMFEILKDWYNLHKRYKNRAEKIISVKDLRYILEVPESYNYGMFKKNILKKTQKDLEEYTDIKFSFEEIKTSRTITHIKFIIFGNKKNKCAKNLDQCNENKKDEDKREKLIHALSLVPENFRNKYIEQVITKYIKFKSIEYVISQIKYTNNAHPENYIPYLVKALENDYAGFDQASVVQEIKEHERKKQIEEKRKRIEEERKKQEEQQRILEKNVEYARLWNSLPLEEKKKYAHFGEFRVKYKLKS